MNAAKTPMHAFVGWLNSLSDTDPVKWLAVQATVTYDHKLGLFRAYLGPREPAVIADLEGVKRALTATAMRRAEKREGLQ